MSSFSTKRQHIKATLNVTFLFKRQNSITTLHHDCKSTGKSTWVFLLINHLLFNLKSPFDDKCLQINWQYFDIWTIYATSLHSLFNAVKEGDIFKLLKWIMLYFFRRLMLCLQGDPYIKCNPLTAFLRYMFTYSKKRIAYSLLIR